MDGGSEGSDLARNAQSWDSRGESCRCNSSAQTNQFRKIGSGKRMPVQSVCLIIFLTRSSDCVRPRNEKRPCWVPCVLWAIHGLEARAGLPQSPSLLRNDKEGVRNAGRRPALLLRLTLVRVVPFRSDISVLIVICVHPSPSVVETSPSRFSGSSWIAAVAEPSSQ